jgi:hypothetical protein
VPPEETGVALAGKLARTPVELSNCPNIVAEELADETPVTY